MQYFSICFCVCLIGTSPYGYTSQFSNQPPANSSHSQQCGKTKGCCWQNDSKSLRLFIFPLIYSSVFGNTIWNQCFNPWVILLAKKNNHIIYWNQKKNTICSSRNMKKQLLLPKLIGSNEKTRRNSSEG